MDHHPSAVVTADPPCGATLYHRRSRQAAARQPADRASLDPRRDAHGRALRAALADSPGGSGRVWRGPAQAHPHDRSRGREPQARAGWRGAGVSPIPRADGPPTSAGVRHRPLRLAREPWLYDRNTVIPRLAPRPLRILGLPLIVFAKALHGIFQGGLHLLAFGGHHGGLRPPLHWRGCVQIRARITETTTAWDEALWDVIAERRHGSPDEADA